MGTTSEKLTYLNTTKEKIRNSINLTGANLTSEDTFRSYASKLKKGYIDIINNGIDTLYNNFPKVSGIGSNLSLTPTYEAPMKLNEIQGDTLQDGTPTPDSPVPIQSVTGLQNIKVCGKNLCFNITKPSNANLRFFINKSISKTFTISFTTNEELNGNSLYLEVDGTSYGNIGGITASANTKVEKTYTLSDTNYQAIQDGTNIDLLLYKNGANFNIPDDGMVENNSTATTYEPYKGNTYEVNLGKNLVDFSNLQTNSNTTYTWQNDILEVKATTGTYNRVYIDITSLYKNNPGKKLRFDYETLDFSQGVSSSVNLQIVQSGTNTYVELVDNSGTIITRTIPNDTSEITQVLLRVVCNNTNTSQASQISITKPILHFGNIATSYSPYFTPIELNKIGDYQDSIKKSTGKNLFDINGTITQGTLDKYNNGFTLVKGTNRVIRFVLPKVLPAGTYTLSYDAINVENVSGNYFYVSCQYTKTNIGILNDIILNDSGATFTTTGEFDRLYFFIAGSQSNDATITIDNVQLEQNNQATTYEPYGKVWYVEKNIGKVVLNGSESGWSYNDVNQVFIVRDLVNYLRSGFVPYSNYYQGQSVTLYNQVETNHIAFLQSTTQNRLLIKNLNYTDVDAFKTWLSTHNTTIHYVLATPTYTEITNTELIEDLETLYTVKSQEGTTNISITSEDLEMILNVSALKGDVE